MGIVHQNDEEDDIYSPAEAYKQHARAQFESMATGNHHPFFFWEKGRLRVSASMRFLL